MSQNGAGSSTLLRAGSSKLDAIRNWGVSTYKCTKQILYEKLGKSSRTVDTGEDCSYIIYYIQLEILPLIYTKTDTIPHHITDSIYLKLT